MRSHIARAGDFWHEVGEREGGLVAEVEGQASQVAPELCFHPKLQEVILKQHPIVLANKPVVQEIQWRHLMALIQPLAFG